MSLFVKLGLAPSERDKRLKRLIDNSYPSIRVVGRGTIKIDPNEVRSTPEFKTARARAEQIVKP
ncbi:hypothetical protein [Sphingomonas pokkalii]|uniref:Uncharacterized protein n=1 Tax=Sphingomonas pokkalii TaxID=2175090 RepID=A0A2U0SGR9_9SPHN|nr:hypothetical protein [Sphingomonas pokkalii]PVX30505.1 hypothetical protein DD559_15085 [Sphingomonas pokkalii]